MVKAGVMFMIYTLTEAKRAETLTLSLKSQIHMPLQFRRICIWPYLKQHLHNPSSPHMPNLEKIL